MAWSICKVFIDVTKVSTLTIASKIRVLSFIHVKMGGIMLNRKFKFQFLPRSNLMNHLLLKFQDTQNQIRELQSFGPAPILLVFLRHLG